VRRAIALFAPLVLASSVCLAIACRTPGPGTLLSVEDPRPALLLESLYQNAEARVALRGSARLALEAPDLRFNRPQRIAVERPGRLRVEILGLFNQLAAVLVTDGDFYQLYTAGESELEEGVVSKDLLWRVARVDLAPSEAVDLLLGTPKPAPGLLLGPARIHDDGAISFAQVDADRAPRQRFRFDAAGRVRLVEILDRFGGLVRRETFDDYRSLTGPDGEVREFAFDISLDFPRVDAKAKLEFKSVELSGGLDDALFELKLPDRPSRGISRADSKWARTVPRGGSIAQ
jgi:hypothetical protein